MRLTGFVNRVESAFRGWLYALLFVLPVPVIFWVLLVSMRRGQWSWDGLLLGVVVLPFVFLVFGFPLFIAFWKRKSIVWFLPVSLALGGLLGVIAGFPSYIRLFRGIWVDPFAFLVAVGYGVGTGFGCWLANRRATRHKCNSRL